MSSYWRKYLTDPGHIRVVTVEATKLSLEICDLQRLQGVMRLGMAEATLGALLIASTHKSGESINLNAKGSGPFRQAIVDASPEGRARGFLITNEVAPPEISWGRGVLSILYTKNSEGKHPYTGMVEINEGSLEGAINAYYRDSEQLASKVCLEVIRDGDQLRARGILIQVLGGADASEVARVESLTPDLLRPICSHFDPSPEFCARVAELLGVPRVVEVEHQSIERFCSCGVDRIERALVLSGEADTLDALGPDPYLEVTCDFCRSEYRVTRERLKDLFSPDPSRWQ